MGLYDPAKIGAKCTGCVNVKKGDEEASKNAVANTGPVSVVPDAGILPTL